MSRKDTAGAGRNPIRVEGFAGEGRPQGVTLALPYQESVSGEDSGRVRGNTEAHGPDEKKLVYAAIERRRLRRPEELRMPKGGPSI